MLHYINILGFISLPDALLWLFSYIFHINIFSVLNIVIFFFLNVLNIVFITDMISFVFSGDRNLLDSGSDYSKAVVLGYVSPKLLELLQIFQLFG
jgi:hypothetical protein